MYYGIIFALQIKLASIYYKILEEPWRRIRQTALKIVGPALLPGEPHLPRVTEDLLLRMHSVHSCLLVEQ